MATNHCTELYPMSATATDRSTYSPKFHSFGHKLVPFFPKNPRNQPQNIKASSLFHDYNRSTQRQPHRCQTHGGVFRRWTSPIRLLCPYPPAISQYLSPQHHDQSFVSRRRTQRPLNCGSGLQKVLVFMSEARHVYFPFCVENCFSVI